MGYLSKFKEIFMNNKTVKIPNISCEHCVRTIENELSELNGVHSVKTDLETKSVFIEWDNSLQWNTIIELLQEINYPPSE